MTLYVVTGPPASGKSTYVQQRAQPGDITIDFDALARVLTTPGTDPHKHPPHIQAVTKAARRAAIDAAITHASTVDVYVIHSMPGARTMDRYRTLGAKVVVIDPGIDVVLARCKRERPWQMAQAAKEWYATTQIQQTPDGSQQTYADQTRQW